MRARTEMIALKMERRTQIKEASKDSLWDVAMKRYPQEASEKHRAFKPGLRKRRSCSQKQRLEKDLIVWGRRRRSSIFIKLIVRSPVLRQTASF